MAELVDALDSGSSNRKVVEVQVLSSALKKTHRKMSLFLLQRAGKHPRPLDSHPTREAVFRFCCRRRGSIPLGTRPSRKVENLFYLMHMSCEFEERFVQTFETATLKGERVTLVGLRESDVEAVYALVQESREHLMAHLPWVQDTSVTDIKKKVRSWVLAEQLSQGGCWKIMLSGNGASKFAGVIMMEVRLSNHSATISYWHIIHNFFTKYIISTNISCVIFI